ncbi:MAG TPA: hypothetical protein VFQ44_28785 [Streptosporangiaceae bacterium]|nr:hypothetical protein [Streptosporangiaceae bacterium]
MDTWAIQAAAHAVLTPGINVRGRPAFEPTSMNSFAFGAALAVLVAAAVRGHGLAPARLQSWTLGMRQAFVPRRRPARARIRNVVGLKPADMFRADEDNATPD